MALAMDFDWQNRVLHYDMQERASSYFPGTVLAARDLPDEEELGFTYDDMDQVFYLLVEEGLPRDACVEKGFTPEFVDTIIKRIKNYRFKSILPRAGSVGQYPLADLEKLPFYKE